MQPFVRRWTVGAPSAALFFIVASAAVTTIFWIINRESGISQPADWSRWLSFSPETFPKGRLWQVVTYCLLHGNIIHLALTCGILYAASKEVEPIIGVRHFSVLLTLSIVGGAVAQAFAFASNLAPLHVPFTGLAAAAGAAVAAYGTVLPELEAPFLLSLRRPLSVRAKFIGIAGAGLAIVLCTLDAEGYSRALAEAGPTGILGGMCVGWLYVKALGFGNPTSLQRFLFKRRQEEARYSRMPPEQFMAENIDPILEKISKEGIKSLTRAERKMLERGRTKIALRAHRCGHV